MNRLVAYIAIAGGVGITLALGAAFGLVGLLTGLIILYIAKPVIEDMW